MPARILFVQLFAVTISALRVDVRKLFSLTTVGASSFVCTPVDSANAASVSYDFGYRFERAIDPDKRGPASDDEVSDALAAMCNPVMPPLDDVDADQLSTMATEAASAISKASEPAAATVKSAAAVAAAAAAASSAPDPAASMEPFLGLAQQPDALQVLQDALLGTLGPP